MKFKFSILLIILLFSVGIGYTALDIDTDGNQATDIEYGGTNGKTASEARTNLGLEIGTDVLAPDGDGSALTGITVTETDPVVGAVNGIVKADGAGNISAATAGTDYIASESDPGLTTHEAAADPHTGYMLESNIGFGANNYIQLSGSPGTPDGTKFLRDDGTWQTVTSGYTNLTSFVDQTAWRLFYSDTNGDVTELALGASGEYLQSQGTAAAPTWGTPSGAGDVTGPASSTTGNFASFADTSGKTLQDSGSSASDFAAASHAHTSGDLTDWDNTGIADNYLPQWNATSSAWEPTGTLNVTLGGYTASRAVEINPSGELITSAVTSTELNYLDGVTKNIQDQLDLITPDPIILAEPDQLQPIADAWPVFHFLAERYLSGVTITSIHVSTASACTDVLNFEEWSNDGSSWTTDSTVEQITLSGVHTEDDGTLSDASIAADSWLYVDLPDTPTDTPYYSITISFTVD